MRITKFGHACVRIEHDGSTIVLDPGVFTDREAVDGADAVLITHEHPDHYLPANLLAADAPVYTIEAVAAKIREDAPALAERLTVIAPDETFEAGLPVRAVGELHAVIHPEIPRIFNSGYVVTAGDVRIYHPGDSLT
jgi:L-ascorbate metabolism protein UlaG (beta-lactamase superfamily)